MSRFVPSLRSSRLFSSMRSSNALAAVSLSRAQQCRAFHTPYAVLYAAGRNHTSQAPSSQSVAFTYEKQLDTPVEGDLTEASFQVSSLSSTAPDATPAFSTSGDAVSDTANDADVFPRVHVVSAHDPKQSSYEVPLGVYPAALPFSH